MTFVHVIWIFLSLCLLGFIVALIKLGINSVLEFTKENSDFIKIVFGIVAALYTAALFHIDTEEEQVATTLAFSEKRDAGSLGNAFLATRVYWTKEAGLENLNAYRENRIDNGEWARIAHQFVLDRGYQLQIMRQHAFYQDVVICVEQDRCHQETACQIFARDIENFRLTYRDFLTEWDEAWQANIKLVLRKFLFSCKKAGYVED